eukprot:1427222-Alexandrium_andersonii.AAC.1
MYGSEVAAAVGPTRRTNRIGKGSRMTRFSKFAYTFDRRLRAVVISEPLSASGGGWAAASS